MFHPTRFNLGTSVNGLKKTIVALVCCSLVIVSSVTPGKQSAASDSSRGASAKSTASGMTGEDFHQLTDKLTQKIMHDIEEYKAKDPEWGKPRVREMNADEPQKSECDYECPNGLVPKRNREFKMPAFKNCRDYDRTWDRVPGASTCCSNHQRCYHTCQRERPQCDSEFGQCMESICTEMSESGQIEGEDGVEACHSAMGLLGMIIMEPGCKMYPNAQRAACNCVEPQATNTGDPIFQQNTDNLSSEMGKRITETVEKPRETKRAQQRDEL